jgi:hypothetical protein
MKALFQRFQAAHLESKNAELPGMLGMRRLCIGSCDFDCGEILLDAIVIGLCKRVDKVSLLLSDRGSRHRLSLIAI